MQDRDMWNPERNIAASHGANEAPPQFPGGYTARLEVAFEADQPVGRVEAWFFHQTEPMAPPLAFVEGEEAREKGSKSMATLTCRLLEDTTPGSYSLRGLRATYLGECRDGEEATMLDAPNIRFVVTDRAGRVPKPPDGPRVVSLAWA